uniref:SHSP domain-containing protein n=1 Tax=Panagrellus redivivus TaxID=6233 RepID=A0A7E4W5W2_PANRE
MDVSFPGVKLRANILDPEHIVIQIERERGKHKQSSPAQEWRAASVHGETSITSEQSYSDRKGVAGWMASANCRQPI